MSTTKWGDGMYFVNDGSVGCLVVVVFTVSGMRLNGFLLFTYVVIESTIVWFIQFLSLLSAAILKITLSNLLIICFVFSIILFDKIRVTITLRDDSLLI